MLEIVDLTKSYEEKLILKNINWELNSEYISILTGDNGCGKSTLLNIIADEVDYDFGKIYYNKKILKNNSTLKSNFSFMLENSDLVPELTGNEYLNLKYRFYNKNELDTTSLDNLIDVLFKECKILNNPIRDYSTGMKKKIEFISCLSLMPNVLIMDEPFAGMDITSINYLLDYLIQYQIKEQAIILITTHDINIIDYMPCRKYRLENCSISEIKDEVGNG